MGDVGTRYDGGGPRKWSNLCLLRFTRYFQQSGWELFERVPYANEGARIANEAIQLLEAQIVQVARWLILMPDQMMLQIHESLDTHWSWINFGR